MGKPRQKATQGHRQQKSSLFRKQTQSFSITQSLLQCFIGGIKDSPRCLSAGMMLQQGVHISKQCNRSSLLSSSHLLHVPGQVRQQWVFNSPRKLQWAVLYPWCLFQVLPRNRYCYLLLCRNVACLSSLIFLLEKYRREEVIVSLSAGHMLSPRHTACSWFSLSNDFGLAAVIITQLGSGKSRPVADACLIAAGCVWRLEDLL